MTAAIRYQRATDGRDKSVPDAWQGLPRPWICLTKKRWGTWRAQAPNRRGPDGFTPRTPGTAGDPVLPYQSSLHWGFMTLPVQEGVLGELLSREVNNDLDSSPYFDAGKTLQPQRDSNPCRHLERAIRHVHRIRPQLRLPSSRLWGGPSQLSTPYDSVAA